MTIRCTHVNCVFLIDSNTDLVLSVYGLSRWGRIRPLDQQH